jgi:hypothetical protein
VADPACYTLLYQQHADLQYIDRWISLASLIATFLRSPTITINDLQIAQEIGLTQLQLK